MPCTKISRVKVALDSDDVVINQSGDSSVSVTLRHVIFKVGGSRVCRMSL